MANVQSPMERLLAIVNRQFARSAESKPQQTGIGLLIRLGEVATTSGSTSDFGAIANAQPPTANPSRPDRIDAKADVPIVGDWLLVIGYLRAAHCGME
jgi:hypothetical protein